MKAVLPADLLLQHVKCCQDSFDDQPDRGSEVATCSEDGCESFKAL